MYQICNVLFALFCIIISAQENSQDIPTKGFLRREFSLSKPYSGDGMTIPFWDFRDNAMITNNYIRLTSSHQGQRGSVWNRMPCNLRDWELHVNFKIYGGGRTLAADGIALWYTYERMVPGPVFGSKDEFYGLGVFLDTYKNGDQAVTFPQISAMVGNGTQKYDHLNDGKLHSIGSCLGSFRNKDYETLIAIRYVKKHLTVNIDIDGLGVWRSCIDVEGVTLPTSYFFGASAATGDLADDHHIVSMKLYQIDVERSQEELAEDWTTAKPGVDYVKPPLDHRDDGETEDYNDSSISASKLLMICLCVVTGLGIFVVIGVIVFRKKQEENRKRFY